MGNKSNEQLQDLFNRLAESTLELSDAALVAELSEVGLDPNNEAEGVRQLLRQTLEQFNIAKQQRRNNRLSIRKVEGCRG
jgi:hypothetical protein